jgi:hypothetical protein
MLVVCQVVVVVGDRVGVAGMVGALLAVQVVVEVVARRVVAGASLVVAWGNGGEGWVAWRVVVVVAEVVTQEGVRGGPLGEVVVEEVGMHRALMVGWVVVGMVAEGVAGVGETQVMVGVGVRGVVVEAAGLGEEEAGVGKEAVVVVWEVGTWVVGGEGGGMVDCVVGSVEEADQGEVVGVGVRVVAGVGVD